LKYVRKVCISNIEKGGEKMHIKAWCPKCNWTGKAKVGRRFGISIEDYECPKCGNTFIKRPYRGTYNLADEEAKLRTEGQKKRRINERTKKARADKPFRSPPSN